MLRKVHAEFQSRRAGALARFCRDESGNLTLFTLMILATMIAFGGLAVDIMRYELTRATLQNTLDRAALASASLDQTLDPEDVVEDYFDKAGLSDQLQDVVVTQGMNFRRVEAFAEADTEPYFLNMVGLQELHVDADAGAEQRITNVEIMMVLDVSGSMGSNNKLVNLKSAATEFVETLLESDGENKISIGMVPFNGQVNLGPRLSTYFNLTDDHGVSGVDCVDLPASVYNQLDMPTTTALSVTADADTYSSSSSSTPSTSNKWCPPYAANIVRMPDQDVATLQGYINGLTSVGATSINAGMKWGVALMDPAADDIYDDYMDDDVMPDTLVDRPFAYDDEEAMKVIVLMTDGEHFAEERVNAAYKTGNAPIWKATDSRWSVFHASKVVGTNATTICNSRPYYVPHLNAWHSRAWTGASPSGTACYVAATTTWTGTTRQTWPQVWNQLRMKYVARYFYANALGGSETDWTNSLRSQTATTTMDDQLQDICTLAKDEDVIIYGIAFEAPDNGTTQIRDCASSDAHFFDATGIEISTAFRAIANNISQLRLIQ